MPGQRPTTLCVTVRPNAGNTAVSVDRGVVYVRVKEPAREGKANAACRKALAKSLGVAPSALMLVRGASTRVKVFAIGALTPAELAVRLSRLPP